MKVPLKERVADFIVGLIRPLLMFIMGREIKVIHKGDTYSKDRENFVLISNHFNTWDSFAIMKYNKSKTRFVATEAAYLDFSKKVLMKGLARTIKKRVGKKEFESTKKIFYYLNLGYSIGIFPEADNTFYGETLDIFQNTGKFLKRAAKDVILTKQKGGYLSQPRWADYFSKHGILYTESKTLFTKQQLQELTPEEITKQVETALFHNDYDFQRTLMHNFQRKHRAEGIERLLYYCNQCGSIMTIKGHGHDIICDHCGVIGTINQYEFIEGNKHDNLVDYNHEQYAHIEDVLHSEFSFPVTLNIVNPNKIINKKIGKYILYYKDKHITLKNNKDERVFDLRQIKSQVNTMRHSFSFDYKGVYYNFTDIRNQFVLYELCRYLNGSYKD